MAGLKTWPDHTRPNTARLWACVSGECMHSVLRKPRRTECRVHEGSCIQQPPPDVIARDRICNDPEAILDLNPSGGKERFGGLSVCSPCRCGRAQEADGAGLPPPLRSMRCSMTDALCSPFVPFTGARVFARYVRCGPVVAPCNGWWPGTRKPMRRSGSSWVQPCDHRGQAK
jgi:hypothetical protein